MQGASMRSLTLVLLIVAAAFVAAPATALAKPEPVKYVLVSHTKGALVTLNTKTGKLTFKTEKGHFGHFAVVVRHGKRKFSYRFTVTRPKVKSRPPVVTVIKSSGTSSPIIIITVTVEPVGGPTGPPGPGTPTTPPTPTPSPTPPTSAHPPVNLSPPVLRGTPVVGDTITLTYGTWSDSTSQTGTWYHCNVQGKQCSVDANQPPGDLYVVQPGDVGHSLLLAETATGKGGTKTVDSAPTAIVTEPPPPLPPALSLITPPVLTGTPIVGDTITLTYGTWKNSTSQTGTWYDCNSTGQDCSVDSYQPAGDLYVVRPGDVGHSLVLAETATGPGGSTTIDSTQTAVVTNPPAAPAPPVRSGQSPYPVVGENNPLPSSLPVLPTFPDPGVACLDSGLGYFSVPIFTIGGPVTPDLCGFWYDIGPVGIPILDPVAHEVEMQELCADWVTVYNYVSRAVYQQPGDTIGKQEYYFDPNPGPPGSGGESGGMPDTCYAYVGGSTGTSSDHWVFVFSDSSIPWPPIVITTLEESISLVEFPYQFPYPNEP